MVWRDLLGACGQVHLAIAVNVLDDDVFRDGGFGRVRGAIHRRLYVCNVTNPHSPNTYTLIHAREGLAGSRPFD